MNSIKVTFDKGLLKGLRQFDTNPLNEEALLECFNMAPAEKGLEAHEPIVDINADGISWGGGVTVITGFSFS